MNTSLNKLRISKKLTNLSLVREAIREAKGREYLCPNLSHRAPPERVRAPLNSAARMPLVTSLVLPPPWCELTRKPIRYGELLRTTTRLRARTVPGNLVGESEWTNGQCHFDPCSCRCACGRGVRSFAFSHEEEGSALAPCSPKESLCSKAHAKAKGDISRPCLS